MSSKPKILLINSYAVNNGDFALCMALYDHLTAKGFTVSIATFYYNFLREKYPELPLVRELLDHSFLPRATFAKRIFLKLNFLFNKQYRKHDIYIGSPGGYMNSYYGLKKCLLPLVEAKKRGAKTAVYSQSVGPLNSRDQKLLTAYSQSIDVILVRDDYSKNCISSILCSSKVFQTKDAAFLLKPRKTKANSDCQTVAVSVREWGHDNRSTQKFYDLIKSYCVVLLQQGFNIEFISTCQGVKNYRDDSEVAVVIQKSIVHDYPEFTSYITVNSAFHTYFQLVELLNTKYCFTIGTRLHMCILSLINGTPAFNISYEVKGIECFKYLELDYYSVDYNEPAESAQLKFRDFLANYKRLQTTLLEKILPVHEESKRSLEKFLQEMNL